MRPLYDCFSSLFVKAFFSKTSKVLSERCIQNGFDFMISAFLIRLLLTMIKFSVEVSRCTEIKHNQKMEKMNDLYIYIKNSSGFPLNEGNFGDVPH